LLAVIFSLVPAWSSQVTAQEAPPTDELTIVLVIDSSGSMAQNDATDLRLNAAKVFVDLLGPQDRISVIDFDSTVRVVVPVGRLSSTRDRKAVKDTIDAIDANGGTDVGGALEAAYQELSRVQAPEGRGLVVLLTDGEPDVPGLNNTAARERYMNNLQAFVSAFGQQGWPIHTVALTEEADLELLRDMARDTRGRFFMAEHASQLATTFTDLVWSMKNQVTLVHETIKFDEESSEGEYPVTFDDYTNQVTLLAVSQGAATFDLNVLNPQDEALFSFQSAFRQNNYTLLTIPNPEPGEWSVNISGSGSIELFVTADKQVKVWMNGPPPNSKLPLGKNVTFSGSIWLDGSPVGGEDWRLEAEVQKPGQPAETVELSPVEGDPDSFEGVYAGAKVLGDYAITLRAYRNDQEVAWQTFHQYVEDLPLLQATLWHDYDDYRVGDTLTIDAHLVAGNTRVNPSQPGDQLQLTQLRATLRPVDEAAGQAREFELFDDGQKNHADAAPSDGSFGNVFDLTETGNWVIEVTAQGQYKGQAFSDISRLETMNVLPPATVTVSVRELADSSTLDWLNPGHSRRVSLLITTNSTRPEEVVLLSPDDGAPIDFARETISLIPKQSKEIRTSLSVPESTEPGEYPVVFQLATTGPGVVIEPAALEFTVRVRSRAEVLRHTWGLPVAIALGALALLVVAFILGRLLYAFIRMRQRRIRASLIYWPEDGDREISGRRLKLRSGGLKGYVRIASESHGQSADFVLPEIERPFSFIIQTVQPEGTGPRFIQGFKALFGRNQSTIEVQGESRTRLSYGGLVRVSTRLYNGDTFEVGGYVFEFLDEKHQDVDRANLDLIPEHVAAHQDISANGRW